MKKKNRDEFNKKVIELVRNRAGNRCSHPDCRVPTSGPNTLAGKALQHGIASHICAAAPGGPRFDHNMTIEQRCSADNAIWLCANHSILIDKDHSNYPRELLMEWKTKAEKAAALELGKPQPSPSAITEAVAAALTALPTNFAPQAIENVHQAAERRLESLDSRFAVRSAFINGKTVFESRAKENVAIRAIISEDWAGHVDENMKELVERGKTFVVPSKALKITGSELLETLHADVNRHDGRLVIVPPKKSIRQSIWLTSETERSREIHFEGSIVTGTKTLTVKAQALDGLLELEYEIAHAENQSEFQFSLIPNLKYWVGKDVRSLPYLTKLKGKRSINPTLTKIF